MSSSVPPASIFKNHFRKHKVEMKHPKYDEVQTCFHISFILKDNRHLGLNDITIYIISGDLLFDCSEMKLVIYAQKTQVFKQSSENIFVQI